MRIIPLLPSIWGCKNKHTQTNPLYPILQKGGNAFDAMMATELALAVSYPVAGNIGGGGFALLYDANKKTIESIDYRERAPIKARENMSLYWSYSESFLPRSGEQYKKLDANAARLDPDVFENSEFGLKWDISDALSMTLSKFDSKQVRASYDNETGESAEIRGTEIDGLELEIKGKVHEKLYVAFGYSNLNGETSSGGKPRELPGHTLSLWAMYDLSDNFGYALGAVSYTHLTLPTNREV